MLRAFREYSIRRNQPAKPFFRFIGYGQENWINLLESEELSKTAGKLAFLANHRRVLQRAFPTLLQPIHRHIVPLFLHSQAHTLLGDFPTA